MVPQHLCELRCPLCLKQAEAQAGQRGSHSVCCKQLTAEPKEGKLPQPISACLDDIEGRLHICAVSLQTIQ